MTHQVWAARQGSDAVLRCAICHARASFSESDFDALNAFVHDHRACVEALP